MLIPKESIQKMDSYKGPGSGRIDSLRLDFNENLLGPSPKVWEAISRITREEYGCYPEYNELISALSLYLSVNEECILATNGSDEAIKTVFDTYVENGDEVILLSPSYQYEHSAHLSGAQITWISYSLEDFSFPLEEILNAIKPTTKLIALANPNNPTGTLIARNDLIKIIEANPKMAVLLDEAYAPYAQVTNLDLAVQYPNVLVTQTFSKAHGLAGLRIGYLISAQKNIEVVTKVLAPFYSVDCLAAAAAIAAIKDRSYVEAYVQNVIKMRQKFSEEMSLLRFKVVPSHANFVLVYFGEYADEIKTALAAQKILVRKREDLKGYLRITIGTEKQMERVFPIVRSICPKPALIFDMDGVLVDESCSYRPCIVKTAESFFGSKINSEDVEALKSKGGYNNDYDCVQALLIERGIVVQPSEIIEKFDAFYRTFKLNEKWLLDEQLLIKLKKIFRLGIFTGRPRKDAWDALHRFGKESFFEVVITDDDVKKRKPDPEGLILAMEKLNVKKAIYFGDSKDDREAAERLKVEFIEVVPKGIGITEILQRLLCQIE